MRRLAAALLLLAACHTKQAPPAPHVLATSALGVTPVIPSDGTNAATIVDAGGGQYALKVSGLATGSYNLSGDVTGTTTNNTVVKLTGDAGIVALGNGGALSYALHAGSPAVTLSPPAPLDGGASWEFISVPGTSALANGFIAQASGDLSDYTLLFCAGAISTYSIVLDSATILSATSSSVTLSQPASASSTFAVTGNTTLSGGQLVKQVTKTGNYTVDGTPSDFIIFTDSTNNTVAITCPAPAAGRCFYVKDKTGKVTTHAVTVTHHASETIDGANTITMTKNFDSVYLCSDSTNWAVMSEYSTTIVP